MDRVNSATRQRGACVVAAFASGLFCAPSLADPPAAQATALPQVTVEASRAALEHQLFEYVTTITHTQHTDEALHRWHDPMCPAVIGLPRDKGEFVLARLSEIARAVGTPLGGERCEANLAVVFTNDADGLIKAWNGRRSTFRAGVRGSPAAFERFAALRGPVRVWYNEDMGSASPGPDLQGSQQLGRKFQNTPTGTHLTGSRMFVKDVLVLASVAVIVDGPQVEGLPIGPLTDYVAMLALADTDPEAALGSTPTILRLFRARADGEPLPQGMSDWDRAYLKALYDANLSMITQRSVIAEKMTHTLMP